MKTTNTAPAAPAIAQEPAMDTITTRQQCVALFASTAAAIAHEEACLAIAAEFLPAAAKAVRGGGEPTPAYWQWLASQIEAE